MPYLEIKLGPDTMLLRFVGRIDYVFGRLPKADVQLRDMKVSRLHTQVFIDSRGNAFMRDLGSSGGTWINNQRLRRGVIAPLTDGAKFRIGESRLTFYDAEPPVNAIEPPGHSMPRGLIRTNARERFFEAEATVLAMDKVDPETQSGPAEPPPEIKPSDFADSPKDLEQKAPAPAQPQARVPGKKRTTGIVEAPWEKPSGAEPAKEKRVTIPPPTRGGAQPGKAPPPPMPSADIDELGNFSAPGASPAPQRPAPVRPLPPRRAAQPEDGLDETGRTSREPVIPEPAAFQPPPPIAGDMPPGDAAEEAPPPRLGMPTVRLERPALQDRQKQIEQEEAEEAALLKIPTASVKPDATPAQEEIETEPQIGVVAPRSDTPVASDEEELTDDQITEYLGGSVSGRFGDIDFGDPSADGAEEEAGEEVSFGGAAAKVGLSDDSEIDLIDEEPAPPVEVNREDGSGAEEAEDEPAGVNTSMLGGTTAISEEAVEEAVEPEEVEEAVEEADGQTGEAAEETGTDAEQQGATVEDVPEYEHATPPPPSREGATADRAFKPRKTRKLMKRRRETGKITDKKNLTPLPQGAQTVHVPPPDMDQPIVPGAKTMFIPKPDDAKLSRPAPEDDETGRAPQPESEKATGKPKLLAENRERKSLEDMAEGPGGDTVAMPPAMMKQLQSELREKKEEPPTIGDNPTVKLAGDDDEEEDFVLDEDYAFFTPPPPTRKAREAAARAGNESDVINANDFLGESEKLPGDKKAASKDDPETLVD
ncbi:MAG: FHA domain-containing protein [Planctomycetes bacterium]|nr:FHA domain-containing protein [Planctomycetota bacterium]MCB9934372.1 FHA domain-containing protein [Planctomycetota bacterium]